jgi:type I restriction enzyme, R subunit
MRPVNSMIEFKQIIGRGTRIREDHGKTWFNIIDYTGSATLRFADADFDGFPDVLDVTEIDAAGSATASTDIDPESAADTATPADPGTEPAGDPDTATNGASTVADPAPRKLYVDGGRFRIIGHVVYEHDDAGRQLRVVQYTDYSAERLRLLFVSADELRDQWADPVTRDEVQARLARHGIDAAQLADAASRPDADPLDLLCHLAFQKPLRTRRERAEYLRRQQPDFFERWSATARGILNELLDRYTEHGPGEFRIPDALQVPPLTEHGNPQEIAELFGGPLALRQAVTRLQALLYRA